MENIYISGFEGKTTTFPIQSSKMENYSILDLREQIRDRTGVAVGCQRLLYGTKELEDSRNGVVMTFQDYGIRGGANIVLMTRIPGYSAGREEIESRSEELNKKERELERFRRDLEVRERNILERECKLRREVESRSKALEERDSSIQKKDSSIQKREREVTIREHALAPSEGSKAVVTAGGVAMGAGTGATAGAVAGVIAGPIGIAVGGAIGGAAGGVVGGVTALWGHIFGKKSS